MRAKVQKIKLSREAERQVLIHDLLIMGVTDINGQDIHSADYYTLRHTLAVKRAITE